MKRFEYSLLGKEVKAQADIAMKQYQKLGDTFGVAKIIKKENPVHESYSKSDLIYNSNYSKYYRVSKKFDNLSFKSEYSFQAEFFNDINKFNKLIMKQDEK